MFNNRFDAVIARAGLCERRAIIPSHITTQQYDGGHQAWLQCVSQRLQVKMHVKKTSVTNTRLSWSTFNGIVKALLCSIMVHDLVKTQQEHCKKKNIQKKQDWSAYLN